MNQRILLALAFVCAVAASSVDAAPATTQSSDATLQICLAAASDYSPVYPMQTIPPAKEVDAVFRLAKGETHKTMQFTWMALDTGDALPANSVLGRNEFHNLSAGMLSLSGMQKPLPEGKYQLIVRADDQPWKSVDFTVKKYDPTVNITKPQEMLPLTPGQVWTYAFTQESGGDAKIVLEDIAPGEDGKFHAKVTMTVAGEDENGSHLELRRNDKLVFEEWWRLDKQGLLSTQRKSGQDVIVLDPPQILWRWPLKSPARWDYRPKDKSYKQSLRMWGPLPVQAPGGEVPGYVVLAEQSQGMSNLTAERHFAPGVGLVREIIITSIKQEMVGRQEMVLQASSH